MDVAPRRKRDLAERAVDVVEGEEQELEMRKRPARRGGGEAGDRGQHLVGNRAHDLLDFGAAVRGEQGREALVLQVAAEHRADARAGDPEGVVRLTGEDENVAEPLANGVRLDVAAFGGARVAALAVPIGEEFPAGRMFHDAYSPRVGVGGTLLSRFRARAFPKTLVQEVPCSVHAGWRRRVGFAALT